MRSGSTYGSFTFGITRLAKPTVFPLLTCSFDAELATLGWKKQTRYGYETGRNDATGGGVFTDTG